MPLKEMYDILNIKDFGNHMTFSSYKSSQADVTNKFLCCGRPLNDAELAKETNY